MYRLPLSLKFSCISLSQSDFLLQGIWVHEKSCKFRRVFNCLFDLIISAKSPSHEHISKQSLFIGFFRLPLRFNKVLRGHLLPLQILFQLLYMIPVVMPLSVKHSGNGHVINRTNAHQDHNSSGVEVHSSRVAPGKRLLVLRPRRTLRSAPEGVRFRRIFIPAMIVCRVSRSARSCGYRVIHKSFISFVDFYELFVHCIVPGVQIGVEFLAFFKVGSFYLAFGCCLGQAEYGVVTGVFCKFVTVWSCCMKPFLMVYQGVMVTASPMIADDKSSCVQKYYFSSLT